MKNDREERTRKRRKIEEKERKREIEREERKEKAKVRERNGTRSHCLTYGAPLYGSPTPRYHTHSQ